MSGKTCAVAVMAGVIGLLSSPWRAEGQPTPAASTAGPSAAARAAGTGAAGVWASDIHDTDDGPSIAGPAAIRLTGARNGAFAGKVVVGGGGIVKATVTDLKAGYVPGEAAKGATAGIPTGVIPASAIRIRYAVPAAGMGTENIRPPGNDLLLESPPADSNAATPVWVTVRVPKDAPAGPYEGTLTLEVRGRSAVNVPLKIDVRDFTLPDTQDYRTWTELVQSPDTLALEYGVPLWSPKHWDLIAQSLRLIADTGSRVVYIPLIARTNYGNAETMVRWIKKPDGSTGLAAGGTYDYDFSIMDKYLDLVDKNLGKPKLTLLYAWEVYLKPPSDRWTKVDPADPHGAAATQRVALAGKGPAVTLLDPATGKTETFNAPRYETAAGKAAWKPLFDALRARLEKRGLGKTLMIGQTSDEQPGMDDVSALNDLAGGLPWTSCAHHLNSIVSFKTLGTLQGVAPFGYGAVALDFQFNLNPAKGGHTYGWNGPLSVQYWRFQYFNSAPKNKYNSYVEVRHAAELQITGNKRGLGHIGADFWPCIKDKRGNHAGWANERFPESFWHNLQIMSWLLEPGPVGTARLEVFREGIQECEARIAVESALVDEARKARLGPELAKRAEETLDQRLADIWKGVGVTDADLQKYGVVSEYREWYEGIRKRANYQAGLKGFIPGWPRRSAKLFDLAGEVEKKLAAKE